MLKSFEELTYELTDYEKETVLPTLVKGLMRYIGKENAISGTEICKRLNAEQYFGKYKLQPTRLRKIIGAIRLSGKIMFLCSSSKGYYVAATNVELDDCIESLEQRVAQQIKVIDALLWQRKSLQQN
tara:strand:+ start:2245 stop:2625 length:381 start_codon:yes stop_codon:yes gene_type:complete